MATWYRVLPEKLIVTLLGKKLPAFYGTGKPQHQAIIHIKWSKETSVSGTNSVPIFRNLT
jgi:hypothetical protein